MDGDEFETFEIGVRVEGTVIKIFSTWVKEISQKSEETCVNVWNSYKLCGVESIAAEKAEVDDQIGGFFPTVNRIEPFWIAAQPILGV